MILNWRRQGIRRRIGLVYLSIFAGGLTVFCALLFQYFQRIQIQAFDTALYNFAVDISTNLEMDFVGRLFVVNPGAAEAGKLFPFHLGGSYLEIRDTKGKILMHSKSIAERQLPFDDSTLKKVTQDRAVFRTIRADKIGLKSEVTDLRLISFKAFREGWAQPLILQIAVPMDLPTQERQDLLTYFLIAVPVFLLLAGIIGFMVSARALRPVHNMIVKAQGISGVGNLSERIPVPAARDEIGDLAVTFNGLLERLERAFVSQDRFVSNASHQLKTPLTILKGELELLTKSNLSEVEVKEFFASAGNEINRMIRLVDDLLTLARLEAGQDSLAMSPVELDEVLLSVVSRIQKLAAKKNVTIKTSFVSEPADLEFKAQVNGDEELLACMIENFIENAVKYSPQNTEIRVEVRSLTNRIEVLIVDQGIGIPEESRQRIFERFHRVQPSSIVPGSGLGLSIAAEIAKLHTVTIELSSAPGGRGTQVLMTFARS